MDPSIFLCLDKPRKFCIYESNEDPCLNADVVHLRSWKFEKTDGTPVDVPKWTLEWPIVTKPLIETFFYDQEAVKLANLDAVCSIVHDLLKTKYPKTPRHLDPRYKRLEAPAFTFVSIHGAPSGPVEYLQYRLPNAIGLGLAPGNAWNLAALDKKRFTPFYYNLERKGDVVVEGETFAKYVLNTLTRGVDLAVISGTVNPQIFDKASETFYLQALYTALGCLDEGGSLVLKIVTGLGDVSPVLLLYKVYLAFEDMGLFRPITSGKFEVYIIGKRRRDPTVIEQVISLANIDKVTKSFADSIASLEKNIAAVFHGKTTFEYNNEKFVKVWNLPSADFAKKVNEMVTPIAPPSRVVELLKSPSRIPGTPSTRKIRGVQDIVEKKGIIYISDKTQKDGYLNANIDEDKLLSPDHIQYDSATSLTNYFTYAGIYPEQTEPNTVCTPNAQWKEARDAGYNNPEPVVLPLAPCYMFDSKIYSQLEAKTMIYIPAYKSLTQDTEPYRVLKDNYMRGKKINIYSADITGKVRFTEAIFNKALQDKEKLISAPYILAGMLTGLV